MGSTGPRVVLLTQWPPDAKYKILARYAARLEPERFMWASLQAPETGRTFPFRHAAVVPKRLHWRLQNRALGMWYTHRFQASRVADTLADACREFRPDVLWVLPELGAAHVAPRLARRLGVPIHMTSHDAHETARDIVPRLYYPLYARAVRRVLAQARSLDAISEGLLEHHRSQFPQLTERNSIACHPGLDPAWVQPVQALDDTGSDRRQVRVIGLCGSMRVSLAQWQGFVTALGTLPCRIEIVALAYADRFFQCPLPPNVSVECLPFAETDVAVIETLRQRRVDACYLGLWRGSEAGFFGRTSLSAKLPTYAAAALPVVVDADADSMAWRLVERHGAGVRVEEKDPMAGLRVLFGSRAAWVGMAEGARKMALAEFNLDENVRRLRAVWGRGEGAGRGKR